MIFRDFVALSSRDKVERQLGNKSDLDEFSHENSLSGVHYKNIVTASAVYEKLFLKGWLDTKIVLWS